MWNKLTDLLLKIYDLVRTTDRHTRQIAELEKQFNDLQRSFERFALAYQKDREHAEIERKLLLSQVQNLLLQQKLEAQAQSQKLPPVRVSEVKQAQAEEPQFTHRLKGGTGHRSGTEADGVPDES